MAGRLLVAVAAAARRGQPRGLRLRRPRPPDADNPRRSGSTRSGTRPSGPKVAFAMLPAKVASVRFEVTTPYGVVYRGTSSRRRGIVELRLPGGLPAQLLRGALPGQYQVKLLSPAAAASPGFHHRRRLAAVPPAGGQRRSVLHLRTGRAGRRFLGPDRQPANLTDENAYVYADPRYDSNDNLLGTLKKTGGPVDVSGGWFDAGGGYEKFAYTASYADALMLLAARRQPGLVRDAPAGGGVRPAVDHQAVEPGPQGAVRPGRHRQRQRQQHDPGRLQLLVPAPAGGPDEREARREPRPDRLLRQVPAGVPGRAARSAGQPQPGRPLRRRLRPRRAAGRSADPAQARTC